MTKNNHIFIIVYVACKKFSYKEISLRLFELTESNTLINVNPTCKHLFINISAVLRFHQDVFFNAMKMDSWTLFEMMQFEVLVLKFTIV